jgi:signal transduction histidine kinase
VYERGRPITVHGFARDLTERRRAEAARTQLAREQDARQAAADRSVRLRALHDAALALAAPESPDPQDVVALLARIVARAAATLDAVDSSLVLAEDVAWAGLLPGSTARDGAICLDRTGDLARRRLRPDGATARVLASGAPVIVPDTDKATEFGVYEALVERGIRSFALVPLRAGERVLGALSLNFARPGTLPAEDQEVLELFASYAAAALDRVRLAAAERQMAEQASQLIKHAADAAALRELDRLKDELLSTVSHELRTPLTVVHGYARMLQNRATTLEGVAAARIGERIATASAQLTRLVEDILDFGRLQRGEVTILTEDFDLVPLLRQVVERWRGREGGERLVAEVPDHLAVHGDRDRIAQAVGNMIENALRYAPDSPVVLRARSVGSNRRTARVEVEDQGPGVSPSDQQRVWEKFFRGAGVAELNVARGSGIGLAVVKALVEAHGGRVGLESTPGLGSRFWFELPATGAAAAA